MFSVDLSMSVELFSGTLALFLFDCDSHGADPLGHELSHHFDLLYFIQLHQRLEHFFKLMMGLFTGNFFQKELPHI
jgi:hypothetical protein